MEEIYYGTQIAEFNQKKKLSTNVIFVDNLIYSITKYLPNYRESLRNLIHQQGYKIVGYARKSPGDEDENDKVRLLQDMINNLTERSFVQRVYVSPSSSASTPFCERDLKFNNSIMDKLENISGDTQGKLKCTCKKISRIQHLFFFN